MLADREIERPNETVSKDKALVTEDSELTSSVQVIETFDLVKKVDAVDEVEPQIKKKSGARKDENHLLRKDQISSYNSKVMREDRERRLRLRNGEALPESPKKKKCVSFASAETI